MTKSLSRADVCDIRNRIEHSRENEFPTKVEIERMCKLVKDVIEEAIGFGACPSIYYSKERKIDEYDRMIVRSIDCTEKDILLRISYQFIYCNLPGFDNPFVLIPGIHIGDSSEVVRFEFEETSNYTEMWKNYPKKACLGGDK
jgi:hypothetical protein